MSALFTNNMARKFIHGSDKTAKKPAFDQTGDKLQPFLVWFALKFTFLSHQNNNVLRTLTARCAVALFY
ncbi:hypothetical protein A3712_15560 [Vibrio sp. HI00D65]|nr:hypothetical protein A3712_15560 [Vibrio sp. HI00D65]